MQLYINERKKYISWQMCFAHLQLSIISSVTLIVKAQFEMDLVLSKVMEKVNSDYISNSEEQCLSEQAEK